MLYDNGPYNGTVNAWTINFGFSVSDSFTVPTNSSIEGLQFVYWNSPNGEPLTTVDMQIGSTSFGGTPQTLTGVTNTFLGTNELGFALYQAEYSFTNIPWSGAGYITLSNACTTSGCSLDGSPLIEWDENNGPSTAYENTLGSILSETFDITGTTGGIPTTTTVTSSQNPSQFDQPVTFTATVTSTDGNPTGTVAFTDNGQTIPGCGEVTLMPQQNGSTATCQTSDLTVGSHTISATYGGDQNFNGSSGSLMQVVEASRPTCGSLTLQTTGVPFTISASIICMDPQGEDLSTTFDWGDNTSTTVNGHSGELLVVPKPAPYPAKSNFYVVTVTSKDSPSGLSSMPVTSSVSFSESQAVFAGQAATVTLTVQSQGGTGKFECLTVTDSHGVIRQASDLGITCNSQPSPITLAHGTNQNVTVVVHTTGSASASLAPGARHRTWFYAFWFPLWPAVLGAAVGGIRTRRQRIAQCLALAAVIALLLMFTFCGGGFTPPSGGSTSTPTPAGSYQVTITATLDSPTGFVQTSLIVPLVVTGP